MAAVGGLDRIHRKRANGIGETALCRLHAHSVDGFGRAEGLGWPMGWGLWSGETFSVNSVRRLPRNFIMLCA